MSKKIDELFATLRGAGADQPRDLAMAMAELRSVAAERDRAVTSLKDAGFTLADGAERWKPPVNERMGELYRRLFSLTDERDKLTLTESFAVEGWSKAVIERDNARLHVTSLQSCLNSAAKSVRESEIAANTARQSLRAAEADAAETESVNSDLRNANRRLVADLAAAMERLNHAESIIMQ